MSDDVLGASSWRVLAWCAAAIANRASLEEERDVRDVRDGRDGRDVRDVAGRRDAGAQGHAPTLVLIEDAPGLRIRRRGARTKSSPSGGAIMDHANGELHCVVFDDRES